MSRFFLALVALALLTQASASADDFTSRATGTSTGGVVRVDFARDGGVGAGGGGDPCTYAVVSYEQMRSIVGSLSSSSVTRGEDLADSQWVVVRCPKGNGTFGVADIYEFDAGPPPVALLVAQAERELVIPYPEAVTSPPAVGFAVVGTETWFWLDPADWVPRQATACLPGACATIVATPVQLSVATGDGDVVTCVGPGRPYDVRVSHDAQAGAGDRCVHVYVEDSGGLPGDRYGVVATLVWDRQWSCATPAGPCGGAMMAPLELTGPPTALDVRDYQAVTN